MKDFIGEAQYPRQKFETQLGTAAIQVWCYLRQLRRFYGTVHVTIPGICKAKGYAPLKERTAKRALARLRQVGLVRDLGFVWKDGHKVYIREVYGDYLGRQKVLLPADVWARVAKLQPLPGRGGTRSNAGRQKNQTGPELLGPKKNQTGPEEFGAALNPFGNQTGPDPLNSNRPTDHYTLSSEGELGLSFSLRSKERAVARGVESLSKKRGKEGGEKEASQDPPKPVHSTPPTSSPVDPPPLTSQPDPPPKSPPSGPGTSQEGPRLDPYAKLPPKMRALCEQAWGAPTARPPQPPVLWGQNGMPRAPLPRESFFTRPAMPRIPFAPGDKDSRARFVLKWYRAAVESRCGECPPIKLAGRTREYFEDAAEILYEHEIPPAAWVAWALDRIRERLPENTRKRFVPQVKMLLSPKTLTESRWQFREVKMDYVHERWEQTPEAAEFFIRRQQLVRAATYLPERTEAAVLALVAKHFPEGYDSVLKKVKEATRVAGQEVITRMQAGHWIWSV